MKEGGWGRVIVSAVASNPMAGQAASAATRAAAVNLAVSLTKEMVAFVASLRPGFPNRANSRVNGGFVPTMN